MIGSKARLSRRSFVSATGLLGLSILASCKAEQAAAQVVRTARSFGLSSDGRTDDSVALQSGIDQLAENGGGTLQLAEGGTTLVRVAPIVAPGVTLDLHGGTLLIQLGDTNATGVRLRSNAIVQNGSIIVQSSGRPSAQGAAHAPVVVGPLYGESPSVSRSSPDEGVSGWTIRKLTLATTKDLDVGSGERLGSPAVQIMGGAHSGLIEDIVVPDSRFMQGGIHLDWGTVGPIDASQVARSRAAYSGGRARTTHPHDIVIRRIKIGRLTRRSGSSGGTYGIRLSGVHDVIVEDVEIASVTEAAFYHTAGDLGFEFADADARRRACLGIVFRNGRVSRASSAYLVRSNSWADNVERAASSGYAPLQPVITKTDIRFEQVSGGTTLAPGTNMGVRIDHQAGGSLIDCVARGYRRGFYIDERVNGLVLVRPTSVDSAEHGISIEHPARPPGNIRIEAPLVSGSGRDPGSLVAAAIMVGRSDSVEVVGGQFPIGRNQKFAIRFSPESSNARARGGAAGQVVRF